MTHPNPSTALASVVVDELARAGIDLFVLAPGSRSTALALAVAGRTELGSAVSIDERSGAFHALGHAKATGSPAAVVTTSGTAVANLMPAVVEADAAGVPLVVVSADRPPEARGVGANQTIDQVGMFGGFVRATCDLGPPERGRDAPRWWRSQVARAVASARGWDGRRGPVQINVAFREPTVPVGDDGRTRDEPFPHPTGGRQDGGGWTVGAAPGGASPQAVEELANAVRAATNGIIVAGSGCGGDAAPAELGARLGWPVLAVAESGLRGRPDVIATGHHLLAHLPETPDLVVRFGEPGPSGRLASLLDSDVPQAAIARRWSDPFRTTRLMVAADPGPVAAALLDVLDDCVATGWEQWWVRADTAVREALQPALTGPATEPAVAHHLGRVGADTVAVASSMPIRDVEAFAFDLPPLVANRGASGIDGFVSTALGMARSAHRPVALAGDLSIVHDANGFLIEPRPACVFVVVDNHGGGIFSFLPQADHAGPSFERLFVTPSHRDIAALGAFHGLEVLAASSTAELSESVERLRDPGGLVIVESDRDENVDEHRRLDALASDAVRGC